MANIGDDELNISDSLESHPEDVINGIPKVLLALVPGFGGSAVELLNLILTPPIEKRRDDFIQKVADRLITLAKEFDSFRIDQIAQNEVFISALLSASRAAIVTHQQEKLDALVNAISNSALPGAPDETRQQMFIQWIDELTPWHIKILAIFEKERGIPTLDLDNPQWPTHVNVDRLSNLIESDFPAFQGHHGLYIQVIRDLHTKGLIVNRNPVRGMTTSIHESPKLTPLAKEFMRFIREPIKPGQ